MKKESIIILMLLLIISCTSKKEKLQNEALNVIITSIENDSFREDTSVKFHTIELISMNKVSGNYINEIYLQTLIDKSKEYMEKAKQQNNEAEGYVQKLINYTSSDILGMYKINDEINNLRGFAEADISKAKKFIKEASDINKSIDTLQLDSLWKVKVFMKASFEHKNEVNNVLDTLFYVLDKNLKLQKFKEIDNLN